MLDRLMIISTKPYSQSEIGQILKIRYAEEALAVSPQGLVLSSASM
jgi:DNA helicase TIP49 (TBP-interacting protein)